MPKRDFYLQWYGDQRGDRYFNIFVAAELLTPGDNPMDDNFVGAFRYQWQTKEWISANDRYVDHVIFGGIGNSHVDVERISESVALESLKQICGGKTPFLPLPDWKVMIMAQKDPLPEGDTLGDLIPNPY